MNRIFEIVGMIVVISFCAGALITIGEMIWYRIRTAKRPDSAAAGKRISVITGASSGLGSQYALRLDKHLPAEDEIWLVARRAERLAELAEKLTHPARCICLDLTDPAAADALADKIGAENAKIRYLINCAGFGKIGKIAQMRRKDQDGMIDLNCTAGVDIVSACIPYLERGSHIMNVCSTAGFQPFQYLNIYAATKAFFLRYSRALRAELMSEGIIVTAVCPYWIKDTEFIGKAESEKESRKASEIKGFPLSSRVSSVAALSLFGSRLGLPVVTPGIVCTAHRLFSKLFPDTALIYIWEALRRA